MFRIIIFCSFVLGAAGAPTTTTTQAPYSCKEGYSLLNENRCVKLFETSFRYEDAVNHCWQEADLDGGRLISIHGADENRFLLNLAKSQNVVSPVWIGLICATTRYPCDWVDDSGNSWNYNHFAGQDPNPATGDNVYMLTSGSSAGQWVSANGAIASFRYFCGIPPIVSPAYCPNDYYDYCYTLHTETLNEADARAVCHQECADLVSIHSDREGYHLSSLLPSPLPVSMNEIRMGGRTDGINKYWIDGSEFNYDNFGYFDPNVGICSGFATRNDGLVLQYQWISNSCDDELPFICKRSVDTTACPTAPTTTTRSPNFEDCSVVKRLTGSGTFKSPDYPRSTGILMDTPCTYIITQPKGSIAQVQFLPDSFIDTSKFELYSQLEGGTPFANLTATLPLTVFKSPTNLLKMVYVSIPHYPLGTLHYSVNYGRS